MQLNEAEEERAEADKRLTAVLQQLGLYYGTEGGRAQQ